MKSNSFVSVVLNVNQHIIEIETILSQIQCELDANYSDYEIVIMSHGPFRTSQAGGQVDIILKKIPCIRLIQLSGAVHDDVIWAAGLENAIGDFIVLFDHHTDPISTIVGVVDVCKSGTDVVVGVAKQMIAPGYKLFRLLSDHILRAIDYHLPQNSTKLRCLSRRAVNSVTSTGRFHHQIYLRIQKTGYPCDIYTYKLLSGISPKKTLASGFRHLIRLMVFNSSRPLRWMSGVGMLGSFIAFTFAVYSVVVNFINGHVVAGWTTTILFMSLLFMLQFVILAFFGEYLSRLLDDRSEQMDYSIVFEKNSAVMINQDRVNVLSESTTSEINAVQTGRDR